MTSPRRSDQALRQERLTFYKGDVERLDRELDGLLDVSGAGSALLIDRDGHLVTRRGASPSADLASLSALVAGSFAATLQVARLLGETTLASLTHQGEGQGLQLCALGDRALLAVVWDEGTNLGMVRFACQGAVERLQRILGDLAQRREGGDEELAADYGAQASAALDGLL